MIEGSGVITGGLISDPGELCDGGGFCYLDHDQRNTLSAGFHAALPWRTYASGRLGYGSGFLNGDGAATSSPITRNFRSRSENPLAKISGVNFTAQNIGRFALPARQFQHFRRNALEYPREISGAIRYRFHF